MPWRVVGSTPVQVMGRGLGLIPGQGVLRRLLMDVSLALALTLSQVNGHGPPAATSSWMAPGSI